MDGESKSERVSGPPRRSDPVNDALSGVEKAVKDGVRMAD
jgi:hypothetical protein